MFLGERRLPLNGILDIRKWKRIQTVVILCQKHSIFKNNGKALILLQSLLSINPNISNKP